MWLRYWNLARDPFDDRNAPFVALPGHVEARARLVHAVESGARSARLIAAEGLGKSTVLSLALTAIRAPHRRVVKVHDPIDGPSLFASLAEGLGAKPGRHPSRGDAWRALTEACQLCRWQGQQVVIAVDGVESLDGPSDRRDLARLDHLDPEGRLTVLRAGRPILVEEDSPDDWSMGGRLAPMTRSEAARYVVEKICGAGRNDSIFTPMALTRLQAVSGGIPRSVNQIARLALMAASVQGLEIVTPDVVDGASRECLAYAGSAAFGD